MIIFIPNKKQNTMDTQTQIKTKKVNFIKNEIKGWFRLTDGTKTQFSVDAQGNFSQWGNSTENLTLSIPFLIDLSTFLISE